MLPEPSLNQPLITCQQTAAAADEMGVNSLLITRGNVIPTVFILVRGQMVYHNRQQSKSKDYITDDLLKQSKSSMHKWQFVNTKY